MGPLHLKVLAFAFTAVILGSIAYKMKSRGVQPNTDFIIGFGGLCTLAMTYISMMLLNGDVASRAFQNRRLSRSPIFIVKHIVVPVLCGLVCIAHVIRLVRPFFKPSFDYFGVFPLHVLCMQMCSGLNAYIALKYAHFVYRRYVLPKRVRK